MQRFAALYAALDRTTATSAKIEAMVTYFREAPPADAAWAVYTLSGRKLRRLMTSTELFTLAVQVSGYPEWLVGDSYDHVGDLAEAIVLLLDSPTSFTADAPLHVWIEQRLRELPDLSPEQRIARVRDWLDRLPPESRFVLLKLLAGALRVGVSQRLVVQALANLAGLDTATVAHRMMGDWLPDAARYERLVAAADETDVERPYPFFLASPLEQPAAMLGLASAWLAEWKWDGIRAQLLRRGAEVRLWSRGEERLDGRFPELEQAASTLPDCVLDGEILAWGDSSPLPFTALQKRIGRLKPGTKLLTEVPVVFLAFDLLEIGGVDWRERPLHQRRAALSALLVANGDPRLRLSAELPETGWEIWAAARERARERGVEGLILKRRDSSYQVGRRRGDWWKWKIDPYTLDAVLIYAQPGHGRRSGLYTDYTFGVWDGDVLVPVAKAYSGLDDAEIAELDRWIRAHTLDRFGPVRQVEPVHVFELAFEAINLSARHKSGIAVRFPRILRWRRDKGTRDADSLSMLRELASSDQGLPADGSNG